MPIELLYLDNGGLQAKVRRGCHILHPSLGLVRSLDGSVIPLLTAPSQAPILNGGEEPKVMLTLSATLNPREFGMKIQALLLTNPNQDFTLRREGENIVIRHAPQSTHS